MPEPSGLRRPGPNRRRLAQHDELTSYDWWLIGLAVDAEISRRWENYPAPPIIQHLRALQAKIVAHQAVTERTEADDRRAAEMLDDSPF